LSTSEIPFVYMHIYIQWNSASMTTHWTALNWSCQRGCRLVWSRHICIPKGSV